MSGVGEGLESGKSTGKGTENSGKLSGNDN